MIKRLFFFVAVVIILNGCGVRYITPKPQYTWPEMASSKIGDSLGIYIPPENLYLIYKSSESDDCCEHKGIRLGQGIVKAVMASSKAVFDKAVLLGEKPSDTYIKALNLRGLLHVKDVVIELEFVPHIEDHSKGKSDVMYRVIITLSLNLTAIDFTLSDIRDFNLDIQIESDEPAAKKQINKLLQELTTKALERLADELARKLVTIYGARA